MKKIISAAIVLAVAGLLFAAENESDLYYYNVRVEKIYTCREGYRIIYRSNGFDFHEIYVPSSWFVAGGKIEQHNADPAVGNYMTVFYKGSQFSHAKLYTSAFFSDDLWQQMPHGDYASRFDVEDIQLEF